MIKAIQHILLLILTCACSQSQAQVNIITTIAGTGTAGYNGDGGPATDAQLNRPCALCIDNNNSLLFCDGFNHSIRKVLLSTSIVTTIAGTGVAGFAGDSTPATNAQFIAPQGICTDATGNIFISDGGNRRVRKINSSTNLITTVAGNGIAGYSGENGLATDAKLGQPVGLTIKNNNLYISDYDNNRLRKVDLLTGIITSVAGNGVAGYTGDGGPATSAQLDGVIYVETDAAGNIYIADQWNSAVRKVDAVTGIITTIVGNGVAGYAGDGGLAKNAQLHEPTGLFVDNHDNLFIADYRNGAIRKVDAATNIITTVAGGVAGYGGDGGPATNAKLKCIDVWVDSYGNIYIADYVTQRIRKVNNAVAVSGVDKQTESKIYPNPTKGIFTIQAPIGISLVNIYNIAGVRVYERTCTTTETEIDITFLPSGVYMVYVQCGEKQYVSKVVKD